MKGTMANPTRRSLGSIVLVPIMGVTLFALVSCSTPSSEISVPDEPAIISAPPVEPIAEPEPVPEPEPVVEAPPPPPPPAPEPVYVPPPPPAPEMAPAAPTDPDYGTCEKAKAAGAGPYVKGVNPEYGFYRDRDGDGTVCE